MSLAPPIVNFPVHDLDLNQNEQEVLDLLVEAARLVAPIYEEQENQKNLGANFYPADLTKEEILKAAKVNADILSPYTMVEKGKGKELIATPYHIKFKPQLNKISKLIGKAATVTENHAFAHRLSHLAHALLDGNYELSDIYWTTMKPYKIDVAIGPIDRLDDRLFFKKASYEAWVGVIDQEKTERAKFLQRSIYDVRRKTFSPSEKANFLDKTKLRVDKTLIFSGLFARGMYTSNSLPVDPVLMEKYGIIITFFDTSLDVKFNNQHFPIFEKIFEKEFQSEYSRGLLREGSFRNVLLHEIGHSLLRYKDAEERLKEFFPIVDELSATIYGIKCCGSLVLKGIMSEKELEAIMIMFVCRAFTWWIDSKTHSSSEAFAIGHAVALNHFIESGALRESDGISWPNFNKMFLAIEELSDDLERLISTGNYEDAKTFVDKYGSFMVYSKFSSRLKGVI
jgi:hypothetical protein